MSQHCILYFDFVDFWVELGQGEGTGESEEAILTSIFDCYN